MSNNHGYIGRAPGDAQVTIARQTYTPGGIQTDFTFNSGYTVGYLDAFINGVRQIEATDYTASDGSTVGFTSYLVSGDTLELVAYKAFNVNNVDSTPGNFSVGNDLTVSGNLTVDGTTTLAAGSSVAYATTSFGLSGSPDVTVNNITGVAATHRGIVNITDTTASTNTTSGALVISGGVGIAKSLNVAGNVTIGGTLRTENKVNVDSIGIVTAGGGLYVGRDGSGAGIGLTATTVGNVITAGIVTANAYHDGSGNINRNYGVGINSAGTNIGYGVTTLNFIGAGNTFALSGTTVDVSIAGGGGGGGGAVLDITACLFV